LINKITTPLLFPPANSRGETDKLEKAETVYRLLRKILIVGWMKGMT